MMKANNQHDYYACQASIVISVRQFATSWVNLHNAMWAKMDVIRKAMEEDLRLERPADESHQSPGDPGKDPNL